MRALVGYHPIFTGKCCIKKMDPQQTRTVLILGANSDVAKAAIRLYIEKGCRVMAASRSTDELNRFTEQHISSRNKITVHYFDAVNFEQHKKFYTGLPHKPH